MATTCQKCDRKFTARQALCHDWRDPERSFGCPHCFTFYVKDMAPKLSVSVTIGITVGGILLPAMWVFWKGLFSDQYAFMVYGALIFLSTISIALATTFAWRQPLVESKYRPDERSQNPG